MSFGSITGKVAKAAAEPQRRAEVAAGAKDTTGAAPGVAQGAPGGVFAAIPPSAAQQAKQAQEKRDVATKPLGRAATIFSRRTQDEEEGTTLARRTLLGF